MRLRAYSDLISFIKGKIMHNSIITTKIFFLVLKSAMLLFIAHTVISLSLSPKNLKLIKLLFNSLIVLVSFLLWGG